MWHVRVSDVRADGLLEINRTQTDCTFCTWCCGAVTRVDRLLSDCARSSPNSVRTTLARTRWSVLSCLRISSTRPTSWRRCTSTKPSEFLRNGLLLIRNRVLKELDVSGLVTRLEMYSYAISKLLLTSSTRIRKYTHVSHVRVHERHVQRISHSS